MGSREGCPYRGGEVRLGGEGRTGDLGNLCTTLRPTLRAKGGWWRTELAGLGASPSVAARQLPLGGSIWIGLLARCGWRRRTRGRPPSAFGISPRRAGGEGIMRYRPALRGESGPACSGHS